MNDQHQKRVEAAENHNRLAKEINDQFRPLIKEAVAESDYDRAQLLEAQREEQLTQNTENWAKANEEINS